jgi:zinc protease
MMNANTRAQPRACTKAHRIRTPLAMMAIAASLACRSNADTATPTAHPSAAVARDQDLKAETARKKRAALEALPPLPGIETPRAVPFPEPIAFRLANGLEVIVLEDHETPIVEAALFVKAGDIYSPAARPVLAQITAIALGEGTKKHSKARVDALIDATGGTLQSNAGDELTRIVARVDKRDLALALSLMAEEAMQPTFAQDALEKIKDQLVQAVRTQKATPSELAMALAKRITYGESSPYGRSFPTDQQIKSITREEVVAFFERHYVAHNAMLVLAGDITAPEAERLAARAFERWTSGESVAPRLGDHQPADKAVVHIIDRPGSAQAYAMLAVAAPAPNQPQWLETQVLDKVLNGGTLSTRLNFVLREQLGLTYGAHGGHEYGFDGGMFWAGGSTKTKTASEFATALLDTVFALASDPLTDRELRRVKNLVSGRYALEAEQIQFMVGKTIEQRLYGLPADFWTGYRKSIDEVTAEALVVTARSLLDRKTAQLIVVGRKKKLTEQLAKLGEVRLYDRDLQQL